MKKGYEAKQIEELKAYALKGYVFVRRPEAAAPG